MKTKNIFIRSVVFIGLLFCGCTDLEEEPVGVLAPESFFKTKKDVESALFGAYGELATVELFGRDLMLALELRSDMVDIGDKATSADRIQINSFDVDTNNGLITGIWRKLYKTISAANAAIAGIKRIEADENAKLALEAEARFLRAFSYYHLVQLFGMIPYLEQVVSSPAALSSIEKSPEMVVYSKIKEDLLFAKTYLPPMQPGGIRSRATSGAASTMLASVYLSLREFPEAAREAKYIIANKGLFGYALELNYQDLFDGKKADNLKETIFTVDFNELYGEGGYKEDCMVPITRIIGVTPRSLSVAVPSLSVYTTWDARDYRKKVSLQDSILFKDKLVDYTKFPEVKRPHIAKFFRFPGNGAGDDRRSDHNYICFRYGEVLLMAAEAINETQGPVIEAVGYINEIRKRARNHAGILTDFPQDVSATISQQDFRELIRQERRLELAFEYKRWYDIKRWGILTEVFTGPLSLEPHVNVDPSRDYLFPIPGQELIRSPNLLPQNPGY